MRQIQSLRQRNMGLNKQYGALNQAYANQQQQY